MAARPSSLPAFERNLPFGELYDARVAAGQYYSLPEPVQRQLAKVMYFIDTSFTCG